eukprot:gene1895-7095_t
MKEPAVVCVEKPYLDGFIDGIRDVLQAPFILVAISGGDEPLTHDTQRRIAGLSGLRGCFATNLHVPLEPALFHPIPIGVPDDSECAVHAAAAAAPAWGARDRRLLVTPMRFTRLRAEYTR